MKKLIVLIMLILMIPTMSACNSNSNDSKNNNKYNVLINALVQTQETCLNDNDYTNDYITIKGKIRKASNSSRPYDGEYTIELKIIIIANNAIYLAETYYQSDDVKYFLFCEIEYIKSGGSIVWEK